MIIRIGSRISRGLERIWQPTGPTGFGKLNLTKPDPAGLKIGQRISRTMHWLSHKADQPLPVPVEQKMTLLCPRPFASVIRILETLLPASMVESNGLISCWIHCLFVLSLWARFCFPSRLTDSLIGLCFHRTLEGLWNKTGPRQEGHCT